MSSHRPPHISFTADTPNRREVVTGAAGVAAAFGLTLNETAEAMARRNALLQDNRPVKTAFIGVGDQGYNTDLKAALSVPGVEMVAICDVYEPYIDRALKLCPNAKGYKDYRQVLDRKDIEAVIIATPLYMHAPITIDALKAGKHVLCEKMMAQTIDQAKGMARAARDSGKVLQIGHQRRSSIAYNHAWELMTSKKVCGKITHIRAQWNRNGNWRKAAMPGMTDRQRNWRMYKELSHGLMSELGTHQIHVVNWFLNAVPKSVVAMAGIDYWKDGRTTTDNIMVIYEYPDGVKLNYTSLTTNQYDGFYEQFMGKDGTMIVSSDIPSAYYREPTAPAEDWMKASASGQKGRHNEVGLKLDPEATKKIKSGTKVGEKVIGTDDGVKKNDYVLEMEDFFNSVRTGHKISCDWKEALGCCVAAIRANEAAEKGIKINIPASDYEI
jgi:predicted dehydrogenase